MISGPFPPVWYILCNGDQFLNCEMMLSKNWRADRGGWGGVLVVVAIFSLTLSLATRFSVPVSSQGHAVKSRDSRSGEPKRQHLNREAARFAEPVPSCAGFESVVLYSHVIPPEPARSSDILGSILYNRPPPPSSAFSL